MSTAGKVFLVGCLAVLVLGFGGCMVLVGWLIQDSDQMEISVDVPIRVRHGSEFEILAHVRNRSDEPQELVSLEIGSDYAVGIAVRSSEPPFSESRRRVFDEGLLLEYGLELAPGESRTLTLQAAALHAGDYGGDIKFCINDSVHCVSQVARTVVVVDDDSATGTLPAEQPAAAAESPR